MLRKILIVMLLVSPIIAITQDASTIIQRVEARQEGVGRVSYTISRTDTIGDYVRKMSGSVILERLDSDSLFGYKFWSKKTDDPTDKVYDGRIGYTLDVEKLRYQTTTSAQGILNLLNGGGGHLVMPNLMKLDTVGVIDIKLTETPDTYILLFRYADIAKYDIVNKFKTVTVNKQQMLPVAIRQHQETLGRVQDLYYEITELLVNEKAKTYNFSEPPFLASYKHVVPDRPASRPHKLTGTALPAFSLKNFEGGVMTNADLKGKVVLLDFWEIWCWPCLQSMPKVVDLLARYKGKGLEVFGIVNDTANLASAKIWVKKKGIALPMVEGNEKLRNELSINAVPLYVLLGRDGLVKFVSEGFSEEMERDIVKLLE